jgi:undecaprenyl pyrophosphate synthase
MIDPATIPDEVLKSEWARRNSAKRKTHKGGTDGRPKVVKHCDKCGADIVGAREFRKHKC